MNLKSGNQQLLSKPLIGLLLLVTAVLFLPYLLRGDEVQIPEADNMDSNIAWYKLLADQGKIWSGPTEMVRGMVGETPRFSYPSGLNLEVMLYGVLDPIWAYAINKLLIYLVAFFSMFFLLRWFYKEEHVKVVFLTALLWATLPFYPHRGISIAGIPMVIWALIHLWEGKNKRLAYSLLFIYSAYSMLVLAGFFVWVTALFFVLGFSFCFRKWSGHMFAGMGLWAMAYIVQDYQMIYAFLLENDFQSHRSVMKYTGSDFGIISMLKFLSQGNYLGVYHWWGYLPILLGLLLIGRKKTRYQRVVGASLLSALAMVVLSMVFNLPSVVNIIGEIWPSLHSFSLLRFGHLAPFFLFLAFGLVILGVNFPYRRRLLVFLVALNIFPYQFEWRNMVNDHFPFLGYRTATFREFYAEGLYDELKAYLGKKQQKYIGHINIHPAVSAFNGLSCIDGYLQNYPLVHKEKVIKVVQKEIKGNDFLEYHIMEWGNKCYLQHKTYPDVFNAYKWKSMEPIRSLDFHFDFLKHELKVDYLVSAIPMTIPQLKLEKRFQHADAAWDIYLYAIK